MGLRNKGIEDMARSAFGMGFDRPIPGRMNPEEWATREMRRAVNPDGSLDLKRIGNVLGYIGEEQHAADARFQEYLASLPEGTKRFITWNLT